jgi:hypothetical protein
LTMSPSDFRLPALGTGFGLGFLLGGVLDSCDSSSKALSISSGASSSSSLSGLARFLPAVTLGFADGFDAVCAIFFGAAFVVVAFFAVLGLGF